MRRWAPAVAASPARGRPRGGRRVGRDDAEAARDAGPGRHRPAASTSLAVCGGDGMVHLGVDLVRRDGRCRWRIVAAGTGNDVARGLGLPVHDAAARRRRDRHAAVSAASTPVGAVDADGVVRWWVGRAGRRLRLAASTSGPTAGPGRGARCATTSPSLRELPVFRPIPYVVEVDGRRQRDPGDARGRRQRAVVRGRHAGLPGRRPRRRAARRGGPVTSSAIPAFLRGLPAGLRRHARAAPRGRGAARRDGSGWRRRASSPTPTASGSARCR